jgi:hypothetical protein
MSERGDYTSSVTNGSEVAAIEGTIERTQGAMSETLDAIQEKLNPGALMEQARGPVEDTSDHIVAEVQRAVRESVDHIIGEARGPIEELGEHLIAGVTSAAEEATDHILAQARVTATEAASDIVARTGEAVRAATIGKVEHMVQTVGNTTRDAANTANDTTKGLGSAIMGTIEQNPLPAALAAIGLGWLYLKRPKGAAQSSAPTAYPAYRDGQAGRPTVGDAAGSAAGAVGDAAGSAGGAVGDAMSTVGETLGSAAGTVGNTVGSAAGTVGNTVGSAAGAVGETVGGAAAGTQDAAQGLVAEVQHQAQRLGSGFQTLAQENPLAVGVAGVAVGSLIGLLVPETQGERQLMGGARDTLLDKAAGTAQETMDKVGSVAQKAEGAAKDEAQAQGLGG